MNKLWKTAGNRLPYWFFLTREEHAGESSYLCENPAAGAVLTARKVGAPDGEKGFKPVKRAFFVEQDPMEPLSTGQS